MKRSAVSIRSCPLVTSQVIASQKFSCSSILVVTCFLLRGYNILPKEDLHASVWVPKWQFSCLKLTWRLLPKFFSLHYYYYDYWYNNSYYCYCRIAGPCIQARIRAGALCGHAAAHAEPRPRAAGATEPSGNARVFPPGRPSTVIHYDA